MLFDDDAEERRVAGTNELGRFLLKRLESVFAKVAPNPLPLRNQKNTPIYLLFFAAGNPKGAKTAVTIAEHVLRA